MKENSCAIGHMKYWGVNSQSLRLVDKFQKLPDLLFGQCGVMVVGIGKMSQEALYFNRGGRGR
jgi:hypothetical protein